MAACHAASSAPRVATQERRPSLLDLFREHGPAFERQHLLSPPERRFLRAVTTCRTAALGGHLYACDACGHEVPLYNSCRNRHCPACQALDQERWIRAREERLLPVGHHHVVFTLPAELRSLARSQPKELYGLLFQTASRVLSDLARERWKARIGITAVLHTWTRELTFHPHLHCIVTAGGLGLDGDCWVDQPGFLFPVNKLKYAFAERVRKELQSLHEQGALRLQGEGEAADPEALSRLVKALPRWQKWVIYIEPPFGRSTHVLRYLGRYTHRVAISDARVIAIDDRGITFRTRNEGVRTLEPEEFIRRFLLHILPRGLHKIRHYGLYASNPRHRQRAAELLGPGDRDDTAEQHDEPDISTCDLLGELTGADPRRCPNCEHGRLLVMGTLPRHPWPGLQTSPRPRPPP